MNVADAVDWLLKLIILACCGLALSIVLRDWPPTGADLGRLAVLALLIVLLSTLQRWDGQL
mgnify:CR=1 FL=1